MNIYILPALVALVAKLVILFYAQRSPGQSRMFFSLVLILACHNLCEVLIFLEFSSGERYEILSAYYVATIWALCFLLIYANEVSRATILKFKTPLIATSVVITLFLVFSNAIIDGGRSIGYVMTAIKGPFYWVFQVFALVMLISTFVLLSAGYKRAKNHLIEIQTLNVLIALAPVMIVCFAIIALMNMGFDINATAVLPLATTLFLLMTLKNEAEHRLTDVRRFLPFSIERKTSNEIMDIYTQYARDQISYRDSVNQIERLLVLHKYSKSDGNASETAELMGVPRSSLYSIFNRLRIDTKD